MIVITYFRENKVVYHIKQVPYHSILVIFRQVYNHIIVPGKKKKTFVKEKGVSYCTIKNEVNVKHVCTLVQNMLQAKEKNQPIYSFKGRDSSATQNIYKIMHMGGSLIIFSGKNLDASIIISCLGKAQDCNLKEIKAGNIMRHSLTMLHNS